MSDTGLTGSKKTMVTWAAFKRLSGENAILRRDNALLTEQVDAARAATEVVTQERDEARLLAQDFCASYWAAVSGCTCDECSKKRAVLVAHPWLLGEAE